MATDLSVLIADLEDESADLYAILAPLGERDWSRPTPAAGWTVADQVSHLAYFDETTLLSLADPARFRAHAEELTGRGSDFPDQIAAEHRHLDPGTLLDWFRRSRAELLAGYAAVDPGQRLPWYGPDMGVASSITARLMETWAHGQDIADVFDIERRTGNRLRHIAHLGVRTTEFSFMLNGKSAPTDPIRVELVGADGDWWTWGPADAVDRVTGTALDFCLVVTQRRHRLDTELEITGPAALAWMSVAQAFAGAPGPGRGRQAQGAVG